ncbi:MAG: hypothetical protein WD509_00605 [Candidatus Paceibacterota bacterium]
MDILEKLFGSAARVKILRLFLFNEGDQFENADIAKRARVSSASVRTETLMMERIGLIKRRVFYTQIKKGSGVHAKVVKKKVRGWTLDSKFKYLAALRSFLLTATPIGQNQIIKRLNTAGKPKLVIIAGAFIQDYDGSIDLLVVGDGMSDAKLESAVRGIESEIGKELRFALFSTEDYKYRMNIYDKLLRDVFDYPHQTILDRL